MSPALCGARARLGEAITLAGAVLLLLADFAAAGTAATGLIASATSSAARVSLGGAFWIVLVASALAIAESLRRFRKAIWLHALVGFSVLAVLAAFAARGWFNDLSLVHEWSIRQDEYNIALVRHIVLVVSALALALTIGVPLGILASTQSERSGRIFSVLNLIQTVPSIALFGLLIGPLTMLSDWLPLLALARRARHRLHARAHRAYALWAAADRPQHGSRAEERAALGHRHRSWHGHDAVADHVLG